MLELGEPAHVLAVNALRDVLQRAHRLVAGLALGTRERQLEQRDERREALDDRAPKIFACS